MIDLLRETLRSLRAHGMRFTLTALGVAWGALTLTFLSAQIGTFTDHFRSELEEIGPKLVFMGPGVILKDRVGERSSRLVDLEPEDVARVEGLSDVAHATPLIEVWSQPVRHGRRTRLLNVLGLDSDASTIRNLHAAEGRFLSPLDVARAAPVAFLGSRAAERMFGAKGAVGRDVLLGSQRYRVIGVGVPKGDQLMNTGNPDDLLVIIPYTTAQRGLVHDDRVPEMIFSPVNREEGAGAIRRAREIIALHQSFSPDSETALWSVDFWETLRVLYAMFGAMRLFLVVAGLVTLFVGAVGVMNIMLVVVGEREAEIGVRKALGATGGDIFLQFFAEAAVVALTAGLLGTLGGWLLLELLRPGFEAAGIAIAQGLDPVTTLVVTGSLVLVAIIAAVVPAIRAARVPPAEALRAF
jgi:putative ABC transport system permease protein